MPIENMAFPSTGFNMFQTHHEDQDHLPSTSLNNANFPSQHFHGNCNSSNNSNNNLPYFRRSMSFTGIDHRQEMLPGQGGGGGGGDDDLSDDGCQMLGEKKKRLSLEQVKALEKSFELGNKLEPERKVQLARALGLQPRQIAIWFQNRRARWKTKQLERDYEVLKRQCDALKADNETLQSQNEKLHAELLVLKRRNPNNEAPIAKREIEQGSWSNNGSCDNSCEVNLDMSRTSVMSSPVSNSTNKNNFPPPSRPPMATQQFLHTQMVQEDGFCSTMFNGLDDHQGFWPWGSTDHHQNPNHHQYH